jgi:cupin 2 domain-containing protein
VSDIDAANLFAGIDPSAAEEVFTELAGGGRFRLERIVSTGQTTPQNATPGGEWYDQDAVEWVLVVQGRAEVLFEGEDGPRALGPGDYVLIPAHVRHRVTWTDPDRPTVWLALHFEERE